MPSVTGNWDNSPEDNMPRAVERKLRLVLTDDWRGVAKELRKQLKPFGLTVKTYTDRQWGDMVDWEVTKI